MSSIVQRLRVRTITLAALRSPHGEHGAARRAERRLTFERLAKLPPTIFLRRWTHAAFIAFAVASTVFGFARTWPHLTLERERYERLTEARAARLTSERPVLRQLFDFYKQQVRPSDRYFVQAPASAQHPSAYVVRSYAAYWLLPAVEVTNFRLASVILSYKADPRGLPLSYSSIIPYQGPVRASVADVER